MRPTVRVICALAMAVGVTIALPAAGHPDLSGAWTLNRDASEFPKEVGFDPEWVEGGASAGGTQSATTTRSGGGRGGRGGGGMSVRLPSAAGQYQSEEDTKKVLELVNGVKTPSPQLTITQTDAAVTLADAANRRRTFHPGAKEDVIQLEAGPVVTVTKWEGASLLIRYRVGPLQELRYSYSKDPASGRLIEHVQLADHGRGPTITRTYDASR
jgi:hypothetical protein